MRFADKPILPGRGSQISGQKGVDNGAAVAQKKVAKSKIRKSHKIKNPENPQNQAISKRKKNKQVIIIF